GAWSLDGAEGGLPTDVRRNQSIFGGSVPHTQSAAMNSEPLRTPRRMVFNQKLISSPQELLLSLFRRLNLTKNKQNINMVEVTSSSSSHQLTRRKPGRASSNWKTLQTVCEYFFKSFSLHLKPLLVYTPIVEPTDLKILSQVFHKYQLRLKQGTHKGRKSRIKQSFHYPIPSRPQQHLSLHQPHLIQQLRSSWTFSRTALLIEHQQIRQNGGSWTRGNEQSALARVSIVNYYGNVVLDTYVRPKEKVTDYRTWVSGIKPQHLENASSFEDVTRKVADLIQDKILIGHAISNDLQALLLTHPRQLIRDTSTYQPLRKLAKTKFPGLKKLALLVLDIEIQKDSHCSVDDARATLAIYRTQKDQWESLVKKEQALAKKEQVRQQTRPPA
ncbi:hypothetical protein PSTT_00570, partial [Puccinia striiformis]